MLEQNTHSKRRQNRTSFCQVQRIQSVISFSECQIVLQTKNTQKLIIAVGMSLVGSERLNFFAMGIRSTFCCYVVPCSYYCRSVCARYIVSCSCYCSLVYAHENCGLDFETCVIQGCNGIGDFIAKHKIDILLLQEVKVGEQTQTV